MSRQELNNNNLNNVAGGKDKIKVKSWHYSCHRCGHEWDRYNKWYKVEITPTDYLKCPVCGDRVRSYEGEYANGAKVDADELANYKRCPWK